MKNYKHFVKENIQMINESQYENFYIDESIIEDYYEKNYKWTDYYDKDTDAFTFFSWSSIISCLDDDKLTKDIKQDFVGYEELETFDYEWKEYLEENIEKFTDDINWKFKSEFLTNVEDEDKADYVDYTIEEKLEELKDYDNDFLKNIIEDDDPTVFYEWVWEKNGESGYGYLCNIYGEPKNRSSFSGYNQHEDYERQAKDMFDQIKNYIDEDKINELYKENEDYDYKVDFYFGGNIFNDGEDQKKLIDYDNRNAVPLYDDATETTDYLMSFEFQDIYIDQWILTERDEDYVGDKMDVFMKREIPDLLVDINDTYGINDEIKKKYKKYTYKLRKQEFNL